MQGNIKLLPPSLSPWRPHRPPERQIAVLMSGGVDSSVTAYLLKEAGWDVLGITMKIPISCSTNARSCCGAEAAFVCDHLEICHYFIDVTEPFQQLIIEPFRRAYAAGRTPNPCADCNTLLKFAMVWDFLEEKFGIRYFATGHYAQVVKYNRQIRLARAKDLAKDQSYFIYGIALNKLPKLVLPLGQLTKEYVRTTAARLNLPIAEKPESMELCFAGEGDYRAALDLEGAGKTGDITDMQGNKIGTHSGIANFTLGQRRGVGVAGGRPLYVGRINPQTNTVALGTRDEVSTRTVRAERINILVPDELSRGARLFGKIRSYGEPKPCQLIEFDENTMTVEFDEPQFAPCPGQKLVLYNHLQHIVAGGTITNLSGED